MVGNALQQFSNIKWDAIRNASDPQIPEPSGNIEQAKQEAGKIYSKYGAFTAAASVIATLGCDTGQFWPLNPIAMNWELRWYDASHQILQNWSPTWQAKRTWYWPAANEEKTPPPPGWAKSIPKK